MSKLGLWIALIAVVVVGVVCYKLFSVDRDEVLKFNETLIGIVRESKAKLEAVVGYVQRYGQRKEINVKQMALATDDLEESIRKDTDSLKQMDVPDDDLCKEFHSSCVAYVEGSLSVVDTYRKVVDYISQHNPGKQTDIITVEAMLEPLAKEDERLRGIVLENQKKMAKEYDIKLQ